MKKIYFKTSNWWFLLSLLPVIYAFFLFVIIIGIINEIFIISLIFLIVMLLITLGVYFGFVYGFKITNDKIRIITQNKVRIFKYNEVAKIEIKFIKKTKKYLVKATVYIADVDQPVEFIWDNIYNTKGGKSEFNINDKNIGKYVKSFNELEKFFVEVIG